jgi:hypothetical protein
LIPLKREMVVEGEASSGGGGRSRFPGIVFRALLVFGGLALLKRLRKSTTRWDHARAVADALSGEKVVLILKKKNESTRAHIKSCF